MQTVSVRVPEDDLAWITALRIDGSSSPSDKIRAIIANARRQREGASDFVAAAATVHDSIRPFMDAIKAVEHKFRMHSEAVLVMGEVLPELIAAMICSPPSGKDPRGAAVQIEADLVRRAMRLLTAMLRLSVTPMSPTYDPSVFDPYIPEVIAIANIINANRGLSMEGRS